MHKWISRTAAAAVIAAAATMAVQPAATASYAPTRTAVSQVDIATRIFDLTNAERRKAGLRPLARDACLNSSAQNWTQRMSTQRRLQHSNLGSWMRTCNLSMAGENVAMGYRTPEAVVKGWMNSPGHRANILNPRYTKLGVGSVGVYATQQFGR